jgi:hypothetical protein
MSSRARIASLGRLLSSCRMTLSEAYEILGLSRNASPDDAKAAYRRLVTIHHPDKGGRASDFIRIRAAYEIVGAFFEQGLGDEEIPVPDGLRTLIDDIVSEFREQYRWADAQANACLSGFEKRMRAYVQRATRTELRRFSATFRESWNATIRTFFSQCNDRCDVILQSYERWYTKDTQAVFDQMYLRELQRFAWRKRFYLYLALSAPVGILVAVVLALDGRLAERIAAGVVMLAAIGIAFLGYRRDCRRRRRQRERVRPLEVVPFTLETGARFETDHAMRRGRRTTLSTGLTGLLLGEAATAWMGGPVVGAAAGLVLGTVVDRLVNPTPALKASLDKDISRFMVAARPQVLRYVLEAHGALLSDIQGRIVTDYQERARGLTKLLTSG